MSWQIVPFEKLYAESSRNGLYKSKEFHGAGIRIINMGEMFAFSFIGNQEMKRLEVTEQEFRKFGLNAGDLLFARRSIVEEGAGQCSLIVKHDEPMVFESSMIRVRLDKDICDPTFYYYYFKSPVGRSRVQSIITGVAQKGIRGSELAKLEIHHLDLVEQQRIADILSTYDDLIDNNNRRIALLEESVHRLYKEWFVHLHFPGHEQVKIVDDIPEGWECLPFGDALTLQRRFDLPNRSRKAGNIPIYASTGITGYHNIAKVKAPGVVTRRSGSLGTVMYVNQDFWPLNTALWVKDFKKVTELFARLIRILCKRSKIPVTKETVLCQEPRKPPTAQMNC